MKTRRILGWTLAVLALLTLAAGASAAPRSESPAGSCALPQPLALLCPALDLVLSPLQGIRSALAAGSEVDPLDGSTTDDTTSTAPGTGTDSADEPGDGSTELGPTINPDG